MPGRELATYSKETRSRLREAAGEVFAERGFEHATVREICKRAGVNLASVSYHFGNKKKLYAEVLHCAQARPNQEVLVWAGSDAGPVEPRLAGFVRAFLENLTDRGRPSWGGRMMAREMNEPTEALDLVVQREIKPRSEALRGLVRQAIGPAPEKLVAACAASIVAQMLHYHFARPVFLRLGPEFAELLNDPEGLAEHIVRFSLGGLDATRKSLRAGQGRKKP